MPKKPRHQRPLKRKRRAVKSSLYGNTRPHPQLMVLCRCGAQWFGRHAIDNPVIEDHRQRCGEPVSIEAYERDGHGRVRYPKWWKIELLAPTDSTSPVDQAPLPSAPNGEGFGQ